MRDQENILYVIVPYFNFIQFESGITNLDLFIKNLSLHDNVRLVVVEGYYEGQTLPDYSNKIYKHIRVPLKHVLWVKENLINIGFSQIPSDWKYGAWIDRDIMFCNPNWVNETISKLQYNDIVQPWKECMFLNKEHNTNEEELFKPSPNKTAYSYAYCQFALDNQIIQPYQYFAHSGQAWAITKEFYNKIGGLYEYCVVGGADGAIMQCVKQETLDNLCNKFFWTLYFNYGGDLIFDYHSKFKNNKNDYVDGLIIHYFHGKSENKNYNERYKILEKYNFNPLTHTYKNENGIICFKEHCIAMEQEIKNYFISRKED